MPLLGLPQRPRLAFATALYFFSAPCASGRERPFVDELDGNSQQFEVFTQRTAPAWVAVIVVLITIFVRSFLLKKQPVEIRRRAAQKRKQYEDLMRIVMEDVQMREKKAGNRRSGEVVAEAPLKRGKLTAQAASDGGDEDIEGLPEASRVFALLYNDVEEVQTYTYGMDPEGDLVKFTRGLLKRTLSNELRDAVEKTNSALKNGLETLDSDDGKILSGEKLKTLLDLVEDKVEKRLGSNYVRPELLAEAKTALSSIRAKQRKNFLTLLSLLRPVVPLLVLSMLSCMAAQSLQSVYYQIGRWQLVGEAALAGDEDNILYHLMDLGVGHLVIWIFEIIVESYTTRAQCRFSVTIRSEVMRSLVQQDYAYFDKNSAGALQERLNRDAEQLGADFIKLPEEIMGNCFCILFTLVQVYRMVPFDMFFIAILPLPVIAALRYKLDKMNKATEGRGRKLQEEAASATAEVLKEIKTVRQFANERHEAVNFLRSEVLRSEATENTTVRTTLANRFFGVIIVSGLLFTEYIGAKHVRAGRLTPGLLFDATIKLNHWVTFKVTELLKLLPRFRKAMEPLGRVCELLQSSPQIEASGRLRQLVVPSREALNDVLDKFETIVDEERGRERTVLCAELPLQDGEPPMKRGSAVRSFSCDGEELSMFGKEWFLEQDVSFPLTFLFSVQRMPSHFEGHVAFQDVHFSYPTDLRKKVLDGLSFTVEPRTKVALVGEAGCGKSSCMCLLQRLYDPSQGCIRIDGVPMEEYNVNFLRTRIVIVDQKPVLFATTVRENVIYGMHRRVSDDEIIRVLQEASLWDGDNGIKNKPDQLLTRLGSGGISLSGGQSQRVSIARAMIRNPDVILLDEATSALDNKNEKIVQEALDRLARRGSALVIAHRLTTVMDSDKIVVVRKGRLAEQGTHLELLSREIVREVNEEGEQDVVQGIYRFLWELQFARDGDEEMTIKETLKEIQAAETDSESEAPVNLVKECPHTLSKCLENNELLDCGDDKGFLESPRHLFERNRNLDIVRKRLRMIVKDSPCLTPAGIPIPDLKRCQTAP